MRQPQRDRSRGALAPAIQAETAGLPEMFAVWEAKLIPALTEELRRRSNMYRVIDSIGALVHVRFANTATWRRPERSSVQAGWSSASHSTGSRRIATDSYRAPSGLSSLNR